VSVKDLTGDVQPIANLCPDPMAAGGSGRDPKLDMGAPGSAPVMAGSHDGGVVDVLSRLPVDSVSAYAPNPIPVNNPPREGEQHQAPQFGDWPGRWQPAFSNAGDHSDGYTLWAGHGDGQA